MTEKKVLTASEVLALADANKSVKPSISVDR